MKCSSLLNAIVPVMGVLVSAWGAGPAAAQEPTPVATTPRFAFHSDLATNLNDALVVAGAARNDGEAELFDEGEEQACIEDLAPSARLGWNLAVDFYAEVVSPVHWSDRPQRLIRMRLAGLAGEPDARTRRYLKIAAGFLAAATPAYEACRWPAQDAANRRWIEAMTARLADHGDAIASRLEQRYRKSFYGLPIRVDVVATAPSTGANSFVEPPHILISPSYEGNEALEILFHEASHTLVAPWRSDPVPRALKEAAEETGVDPPDDLWHVVLFYTTGEVVRRALEEVGEAGYTPFLFAHERFGRGTWGRARDALEKAWPAYLDGGATLEEAAAGLLRALGETESSEKRSSRTMAPVDPEEVYEILANHLGDFEVRE